jgi:hypothetical protein
MRKAKVETGLLDCLQPGGMENTVRGKLRYHGYIFKR